MAVSSLSRSICRISLPRGRAVSSHSCPTCHQELDAELLPVTMPIWCGVRRFHRRQGLRSFLEQATAYPLGADLLRNCLHRLSFPERSSLCREIAACPYAFDEPLVIRNREDRPCAQATRTHQRHICRARARSCRPTGLRGGQAQHSFRAGHRRKPDGPWAGQWCWSRPR